MKALSIKQPWAWLIVNGHKDIENRNWKTNYRGKFLIHASRNFDYAGYQYVRETFPRINLPPECEYKFGGIIGKANLIDCVDFHQSPWFGGEYGFVISEAENIDFIPCKGKLGFFDPDQDETAK